MNYRLAQVDLGNYEDNCQFLRVQGYLLNRRVYKDLCKKVRELNRLGYKRETSKDCFPFFILIFDFHNLIRRLTLLRIAFFFIIKKSCIECIFKTTLNDYYYIALIYFFLKNNYCEKTINNSATWFNC